MVWLCYLDGKIKCRSNSVRECSLQDSMSETIEKYFQFTFNVIWGGQSGLSARSFRCKGDMKFPQAFRAQGTRRWSSCVVNPWNGRVARLEAQLPSFLPPSSQPPAWRIAILLPLTLHPSSPSSVLSSSHSLFHPFLSRSLSTFGDAASRQDAPARLVEVDEPGASTSQHNAYDIYSTYNRTHCKHISTQVSR